MKHHSDLPPTDRRTDRHQTDRQIRLLILYCAAKVTQSITKLFFYVGYRRTTYLQSTVFILNLFNTAILFIQIFSLPPSDYEILQYFETNSYKHFLQSMQSIKHVDVSGEQKMEHLIDGFWSITNSSILTQPNKSHIVLCMWVNTILLVFASNPKVTSLDRNIYILRTKLYTQIVLLKGAVCVVCE